MTKLKGRNIIFILIIMALLIPEALVAKTNISKSPLRESWAPRIAIDFAGNLHVAWLELSTSTSGDIFYSRYDAITKTWSDPINLSNSGNIFSHSLWAHDIAADSSNRVYVVWVEKNSAKLRIWDGVWGPEILVNSGGWYYDSPRLEVSPEGDIFIIWWTEDGMIWSKARVGGEWEATRLLSPST
ncbi:MAG: hypothetical protein N3B16_05295, partial [Candidatus Aminicenantes bacterium]|nr:hypothetical protein [Candidatus Aminicenantes bacterium]